MSLPRQPRKGHQMRCLIVEILCVLCASTCLAARIHDTTKFETTIKRVSGRVVGIGRVNRGVTVRVFDHPEVWSDDSLSVNEKRKRQLVIATTTTGLNGEFMFRHLPK